MNSTGGSRQNQSPALVLVQNARRDQCVQVANGIGGKACLFDLLLGHWQDLPQQRIVWIFRLNAGHKFQGSKRGEVPFTSQFAFWSQILPQNLAANRPLFSAAGSSESRVSSLLANELALIRPMARLALHQEGEKRSGQTRRLSLESCRIGWSTRSASLESTIIPLVLLH